LFVLIVVVVIVIIEGMHRPECDTVWVLLGTDLSVMQNARSVAYIKLSIGFKSHRNRGDYNFQLL